MKLHLGLLIVLFAPCSAALADVLYVNANLTTGLNDGSSWANALQGPGGLQAVLAGPLPDEIWVARGRYVPSPPGDRTISFDLRSNVEIYGSFAGTEATRAERPPFGTAPSVLSGDLLGNDAAGLFDDNSYHVVQAVAGATTVLDGFFVTGGNADGAGFFNRGGGMLCIGSPTVRNCRFVRNHATYGGGAAYANGSSPAFVDCVFERNSASSFSGVGGGGVYLHFASSSSFDRCRFERNDGASGGGLNMYSTLNVRVSNCLFWRNVTTGNGGGGALRSMWSAVSLRNCTVVANRARGIVASSDDSVANCILWDNVGYYGGQTAQDQISGTSDITYSIVEGGVPGTGNLAGDPLFVDAGAANFALTLASPAVDAGDNSAVPAVSPLDAARAPRFVDEPSVVDTGAGTAPIVDIGAFELSIGTSDPGCEPTVNSTGGASTLTATGSLALADNDVELAAYDLPPNEPGYFLMSAGTAALPVASGVLCLGGPQFRFDHAVLRTTRAGHVTYTVDVTSLPQGQVFAAGETWYFQLWHRDGAGSNFSRNLCFDWE